MNSKPPRSFKAYYLLNNASCPVGRMWNESEGGENAPVDAAPDDRLDVSDAVEHRGEGTGETLRRRRWNDLGCQLHLGETVAFDFIYLIKGSSTTK